MLLDMNILQKYVTYRMFNIILYEKLKEINHLHQMIITQKFLFLSLMQNDKIEVMAESWQTPTTIKT